MAIKNVTVRIETRMGRPRLILCKKGSSRRLQIPIFKDSTSDAVREVFKDWQLMDN